MSDKAKPVLKWVGGKTGLLEQMRPLFPRSYRRYVEPFLGGAAVFLSLPESPALLNDINGELVHLYSVVRDEPHLLAKALEKYAAQYSEDFYYKLRQKRPASPIQKAARTIFLNKTGFNGLYRVNSKAEFNVPFGKRAKCPRLFSIENLMAVSKKLQKAKITSEDFERVLEKCGKGDFVYCDPPYAPVSATASFTSYTEHGFTADHQIRLRNACDLAVQRGATVAVSNSWTPPMLDLFQGWSIHEISARRAVNSKADGRGPVSEILAIRGS